MSEADKNLGNPNEAKTVIHATHDNTVGVDAGTVAGGSGPDDIVQRMDELLEIQMKEARQSLLDEGYGVVQTHTGNSVITDNIEITDAEFAFSIDAKRPAKRSVKNTGKLSILIQPFNGRLCQVGPNLTNPIGSGDIIYLPNAHKQFRVEFQRSGAMPFVMVGMKEITS